jgi:hypothetical protein
MISNQVSVHEVDGRRMNMVVDGLAEYVAALGAEFVDMGAVGVLGDRLPLRTRAYRTAAALLSVYRSRVDFLRHGGLDPGADSMRYRFTPMPALTGPEPAATH